MKLMNNINHSFKISKLKQEIYKGNYLYACHSQTNETKDKKTILKTSTEKNNERNNTDFTTKI